MTRSCKPIGAIILGGHVQGLGIIRSLGMNSITTHLIDNTRTPIARFSKYCRRFYYFPQLKHEEALVSFLVKLAKTDEFFDWVLFPTDDSEVAALSKNHELLSSFYTLTTPKWEVTRIAYDKRLAYDLAKSLGIPIPKTYFPRDLEHIKTLSNSLDFPLIIKPAIMHKLYEKTRYKLMRVDSYLTLKEGYERISGLIPNEQIMLQEPVPGPVSHIVSYCSLCKDGIPVVSYLNRHLRQLPMDFGKVATIVELTKNEVVAHMAQRLLKAMNYSGPSEVEFKLDERDGQFKFLDMNPRFWKQHTLGLTIGINMPLLAFKQALHEELNLPQPHHMGAKWMEITTDVFVSMAEILSGRMSIRDYVRSLENKKVFATLSASDPMPFLVEFVLLPVLFLRR